MVTNKTKIASKNGRYLKNDSGKDCEENRDCDDELGKHLQ